MLTLQTPLEQIQSIGPRFTNKLKKLGIKTVKDLAWHFPTRYEDFSEIYKIADLAPRQEATIRGKIVEISGRRAWHRRLYVIEALISDGTDSIRAVWFNQPYIKNVLQPGREANFSGKVSVSKENEIYFSNPTYELTRGYGQDETKHTGRIVPIYPETKGLTSKGLRYLIQPLLKNLPPIAETIPPEFLKKEKLPGINAALEQIHFPETLEAALNAKKRFAFEDLFTLQLLNIRERLKLAREKAPALEIEIENVKTILSRLPFELTNSQKKSLWEIIQDLRKNHPMNRLLQGDVGSGKTIIAAITAILVAENDYQTAFMAPTEILARQHFNTFIKFFQTFENGVALLTSSEAEIFYGQELRTKTKKQSLIKEITDGKIAVIFGTHALIQKNIAFRNLGLVVIDEQHRFGVRQRAVLIKNKKIVPHFLSMSATPIPRTLSLTVFGDLDLSLITELPKNRKPIITKAVAPIDRARAYAFIRGQIKKNRQAFVICPRIEPRTIADQQLTAVNLQQLEIKSVKEEYEKLSKKIFPDLKVAMLHGKLKAKEKEKIMSAFANASADKAERIDILVATSVVEVGVDVPNATIMMIEGSERFGLAQLYQFRGRVGRGEHQSFCFLFSESGSKATQQRLKSIVEAKNGLELAEHDLKIRGPGEFFGTVQTGIPDLAMKAVQNPELVKSAREAAVTIIKADPTLKNHSAILEKLNEFKKEIHWE